MIEEVGQPDVETFVESMGQAASFVDDALRGRGIAWEDTVIGGFSQGGAVATGARARHRAAARRRESWR